MGKSCYRRISDLRTKVLLITAIVSIFIAGAVPADNTLVIRLDQNNTGKTQQQTKSDLQLKHETLGATRQATTISSRKSQTSASNIKQGNEAAIGRVGVVSSGKADIYRGTDNATILYTCPKDTYLAITADKGNWYGALMADGSTGWIAKQHVVLLDYQIVGQVPQTSGFGVKVVNTALQYLGIQYKWGGYSATGIDCSGFVKSVYATQGIGLPRVARDQAQVGKAVGWQELQAGDRLYFSCKGKYIDHCGIYMGEGHFIHSSIGRGGVAVDNITKRFWVNSLVAARRS